MISVVACCHYEALCTCRSSFSIAKKWCCDQDVKVVPSATLTKRTCDRCSSLGKGGLLLQPLGRRFGECAIHHERDVHKNNTQIMWCKQVIIEWSWWMTSNNACDVDEQLIVLPNSDNKSDLNRWSLLLLAVTVLSFAHLPLGLSNRNISIIF